VRGDYRALVAAMQRALVRFGVEVADAVAAVPRRRRDRKDAAWAIRRGWRRDVAADSRRRNSA
jgi:hypothetical protein